MLHEIRPGAPPPDSSGWVIAGERRMAFRGHLILSSGSEATLLHDAEAARWILSLLSSQTLEEVLKILNGGFCGALLEPSGLHFFADRFATYPLFYRIEHNRIRFGDDLLELGRSVGALVDVDSALALAAMEFIPGTSTLAKGIEQVAAGQIVNIWFAGIGTGLCVMRSEYWRLSLQPTAPADDVALESELCDILHAVAEDWSVALSRLLPAGASIAIPLSGGLDSRLLLAMFAPHLGDRLVTVCYGDPQSEDVILSQRVGAAAGVAHRLTPFTDGSFISGDRRRELVRHIGGTTRFTLADGGLALAETFGTDAGDVAIFLPGHSGDGISGSKLKGTADQQSQGAAFRSASAYHASFAPPELARLLQPCVQHMAENPAMGLAKTLDGQDQEEMLQRWVLEQLVFRRVNPELILYRRRHTAFLPFFDTRIVDFFSRIPRQFLYRQALYISSANRLFQNTIPALSSIPLQGRGGTPATLAGRGGQPPPTLAGRILNRAIRQIAPIAYERRQTSCPMMALWKRDARLRASYWAEIENARVLPEILDGDKLIAYLQDRAGRDYNMTTLGLWNLLTVELFGRALLE